MANIISTIKIKKSSSRIQSMCKLIGLEDRFSPKTENHKPIDYVDVKKRLSTKIELSKCFIANSLRP